MRRFHNGFSCSWHRGSTHFLSNITYLGCSSVTRGLKKFLPERGKLGTHLALRHWVCLFWPFYPQEWEPILRRRRYGLSQSSQIVPNTYLSSRNNQQMSVPTRSLLAGSCSDDDSLASSPFTKHLTSGAFPKYPSNQHSDYGFIALLALAQRLDIHFLPITWQAALGKLGEGGQAGVNQALIHVQTSFAFKCFKNASPTSSLDGALFREVINEIAVLSHPIIREHPHIVRLEGICWDISRDDRVWPVLVFEKAHLGDLDRFVTSTEGTKLSMQDRLNLCVDIGIAIRDMHSNSREFYSLRISIIGLSDAGIIHGDIKPENVLVFEHEPNNYIARVADFGYSTRFCGEQDLIKMPISYPWNAPEYLPRGFHSLKAKKMDVYSFGLVCLWLLFEGNTSRLPQSQTSSNDGQGASFTEVLESRINKGDLLKFSIGLVEECGDFSSDTKLKLRQFFNCTLTSDPDKRSAHFETFLDLLVPSR